MMKLYDGKPTRYAAVSWVGSFTGIISLFLVTWLLCEYSPVVVDSWVITAAGAFGAQTVILFTLPLSPASQPWNCVFGSVVSPFIGVASRNIFVSLTQLSYPDSDPDSVHLLLLATALANSVSILVMHLTDSVHPPAGAFAFIAVHGGERIWSLGYFYAVLPVGVGSVWLVLLSWVVNNYLHKLVEHLFGDKKEQGGVDREEKKKLRVEKDETLDGKSGKSLNMSVINSSDHTLRKYPSGTGLGAWIRPFRANTFHHPQ